MLFSINATVNFSLKLQIEGVGSAEQIGKIIKHEHIWILLEIVCRKGGRGVGSCTNTKEGRVLFAFDDFACSTDLSPSLLIA